MPREMPTLALFQTDPPRGPDAWHQVVAPGGYEWWRFEAEDPHSGIALSALFCEGCAFHPAYVRRVERYRRRPTRTRPPLPAQYPCVRCVVYQKDKLVGGFTFGYPSGGLSASSETLGVRLGANAFELAADGCYLLRLRGRGAPGCRDSAALEAHLRFQTISPSAPVEVARNRRDGEHRWVVSGAPCRVDGHVDLPVGSGRTRVALNGLGFRDHGYGTRPPGRGLRCLIHGHVLGEDGAAAFEMAVDRAGTGDAHLMVTEGNGRHDVRRVAARLDWPWGANALMRCPRRIELGDELLLSEPRPIDRSSWDSRVLYRAVVRGRNRVARCELAWYGRLHWPVVGRLVAMSIIPADRPV